MTDYSKEIWRTAKLIKEAQDEERSKKQKITLVSQADRDILDLKKGFNLAQTVNLGMFERLQAEIDSLRQQVVSLQQIDQTQPQSLLARGHQVLESKTTVESAYQDKPVGS